MIAELAGLHTKLTMYLSFPIHGSTLPESKIYRLLSSAMAWGWFEEYHPNLPDTSKVDKANEQILGKL